MFDRQALAGKRILITGGGTGLGAGVAEHLAGHGAELHLWGRRPEILRETAAGISERHAAQVFTQPVDIRKPELVEAAAERIWAEHGPLSGVVNNAAANFLTPTQDLTPHGFDAITATVMQGTFHTTLACGRRWIEQRLTGSVVSTLATWVWTGSAFVTASAMAKAAVHAMTMSLAVEWAPHGIRVNAVAPGPFPTEYAWKALAPTAASAVGATQADGVPMRRFGRIEELGNIMTFLLSDGCDYLTGVTIPVDGGHHLAAPSTFAGLAGLAEDDWAAIRERSRAASAAAKAQRRV
jgi:NAD(P)-dependent dehydrogenase (short-subunit alcohol dehydrogenase family)